MWRRVVVSLVVVCLVGVVPVGAVGAQPADEHLGALEVVRLAGADRYATSLLVAEGVAADADGSLEWVVVVSGESWPDAVVASSVAGDLGAAVVLTPPGGARADMLEFLSEVGVSRALVVSTGDAVSSVVDEQLGAAGVSVERVGGADRYETSVAVARRLGMPGVLGTKGRTVLVASGEVFVDALVAGPLSAHGGHPVLLSPQDGLHPSVASYLGQSGADHAVVLGGTAALAAQVSDAVAALGISVERVAGATRVGTATRTAALTADQMVSGCPQRAQLGLARADVPFDAFAAGPLLADRCAALVLSETDQMPNLTASYLNQVRSKNLDGVTLYVFGGNAAIAQTTIDDYLETTKQPDTDTEDTGTGGGGTGGGGTGGGGTGGGGTGGDGPTNQAPKFENLSTQYVLENNELSYQVTAVDDDSDDDIESYTLQNHTSHFSINSSTGLLTSNDPLNHEERREWDLRVAVTSGSGSEGRALTVEGTVEIVVRDDVNLAEAPEMPSPQLSETTAESVTIAWAEPANTGPPITGYNVQYRRSGNTDPRWLDGGNYPQNARSATIRGLTAQVEYEFQMQAVNDEGTSEWSGALSATPSAEGNEPPEITGGESVEVRVNENTKLSHRLTASDPDSQDALGDFAIVGGVDMGSFELDPDDDLTFFNDDFADFEAQESYEVVISVTSGEDSRELTALQTITITVLDAVEKPGTPVLSNVVAPTYSTLVVEWDEPENSGPPISDYDVQYRISGETTWSTWTHNGTVDQTRITGLNELTTYEVQVRAGNDEGESAWSELESATTPETPNVAPKFTNDTSVMLAENAVLSFQMTAEDEDALDSILTFSIDGGADAGSFVTDSSGVLRFADSVVPSYESQVSYRVRVRVSSGLTINSHVSRVKNGHETIDVLLTDVDEAPTTPSAPSASGSTADSATIVWTEPTNTGPEINDYNVRYGTGRNGPWIDWDHVGTATTRTISGLSDDTTYYFQVQADNTELLSGWSPSGSVRTSAVRNLAPVLTSGPSDNPMVAEDADPSTFSYQVDADDPDSEDEISGYAITGGADSGAFQISSSGLLTLKSAVELDHETKSSYAVVVRVTGGTGSRALSTDLSISLSVTDVNEPPEFTGPTEFQANENTDFETMLSASDVDTNDNIVRFDVVGGANRSNFAVSNNGVLRSSDLDYETNASLEVVIEVTSGIGGRAMTASQTVTVDVEDVNETPTTPANLQPTSVGETSVELAWDFATSEDSSAIMYVVEHKLHSDNSASAWTAHTATRGKYLAVSGLSRFTEYDFRVRAENAGGESSWSGMLTLFTDDCSADIDTSCSLSISNPTSPTQNSAPNAPGVAACCDLRAAADNPADNSAIGTAYDEFDIDWIAVTLVSGEYYTIHVSNHTLGQHADIEGIYDSNGNLVSNTSDDTGAGKGSAAAVIFQATASAEFFVAVAMSPDVHGHTGGYTLRVAPQRPGVNVSEPSGSDLPQDPGSVGHVLVGGEVTGAISNESSSSGIFSDYFGDTYSVVLDSDTKYRFDLKGNCSSDYGGTLGRPYLWLTDLGAETLSFTDDVTHLNNRSGLDFENYGGGGCGVNALLQVHVVTAGVFWLEVGAPYNSRGTYTLAVSEDDCTSDNSAICSIRIADSSTGDLESDGDRDWFGVRLPAGTAFEVRVKGASSTDEGGTLADPAVQVYGSDGAALSPAVSDDNSGADNNAEVSFTPADEGYYYIEVYDPDGSGTGTYTVELERVVGASPQSVDQPIGEDLPHSVATAGLVAPGHPAWGILSSSTDFDWFKVEMAANTLYHIDVKGAADADFGGTLVDPTVSLRRHDGLHLSNFDDDSGEGNNARIVSYTNTTGEPVHFIEVGGTAPGSYRVEVTAIVDICSADTTTSCSVPVGAHVDETLNSSADVDWFSAILEQDTEYTLYLESRSNGETPLEDPRLIGVYDSSGAMISDTSDADSGIGDSSRVSFTPDTGGTFYVAAGLDSGGVAGDYRLWAAKTRPGVNVSEPAGADFASHVGSAGHVVDGGQATGTITDNDTDVFGVVLEADETYVLAVRGDCSEDPGGTLSDTFMRLLTADGTAPFTFEMTHENPEDPDDLFVSDDGGYCLDSKMTVSVLVGGLYYIEVSAYDFGSEDYIGTYTVVVAKPSDDCSEDTSTGCRVTAVSGDGELETAGDVDWFSATLTAGRSYRIRASGACGPSDFALDDPIVAMFDSSGSAPTAAMATHLNPAPGEDPFTDDNSDFCNGSLLEVEVLATGTYYFEVKAADADLLGVYSLYLSEAVDECEATTATSCRATLGSMVTGAVQLTADVDWFALTLEQDVPYNLVVEAVRSSFIGHADRPDRIEPQIAVYDSSSNAAAGWSDADSGEVASAFLTFTPSADGTYYVAVRHGADGGQLLGHGDEYRLWAAQQQPDSNVSEPSNRDLPGNAATSGHVLVGGTATGRSSAAETWFSDADWFGMELEANKQYRVDVKGACPSDNGGTATDMKLSVVAEDGNNPAGFEITADDGRMELTDDNSGACNNAQLEIDVRSGGVYYLVADYNWVFGTYTVAVTDITQ